VASGWKSIHVQSDFSYETGGSDSIYTGDCAYSDDLLLFRTQLLADLCIKQVQLTLEKTQPFHELLQHEPVVFSDPTLEGVLQLRNSTSQFSARHFGQSGRI